MSEKERETYTNREQLLDLRRQVLIRLVQLNYHAYGQAMVRLLRAIGYRDVNLGGRTTVHAPTSCGGLDITATLRSGVSASAVLVQAKQSLRPIQRRFIDELRGTMLRVGASHGLILTTATFSDKAVDAASLYPGRPVRLVAGPELARLMITHFIGVRSDPLSSTWPRSILDEQFFQALEDRYR